MSSSANLFLLIAWNMCISPENASDLRFWLGCRALIPCEPPSFPSDSFKWFYKEDERSKTILLYFEDKSGVSRYDASRRRVNMTRNRSLVIDNFAEGDQGLYWCENCKQDICSTEQPIISRVQKEILNEIQKTFYIPAGSSFTQTCSGEFPDLKLTFEMSETVQESERRPETVIKTTNKSIHIAVVKSSDAGKYTCWASPCGGPSQKLLTVNLCVIKVHGEDSSLSCAVTCDVGFYNPINISRLLVENTKISVGVDPFGSLFCNASQISDGHTTVTSKYISPTNTEDSWRTEHLKPFLYGVSVAVACLIIITFLIFCSRSRWRTAFPFCISCCGFSNTEEEEECTVIYSSVATKTPANIRNNHTAESDCFYSEIRK